MLLGLKIIYRNQSQGRMNRKIKKLLPISVSPPEKSNLRFFRLW
jgi:hypothetical protein